MWGHFRLSFTLVTTNNMVVIYWEPLVRIDSDTEETRIGVDQESNITFRQIVDDGGFREVGHVGQIFKQFVLWRILLFDLVIWVGFFFAIGTKDLNIFLRFEKNLKLKPTVSSYGGPYGEPLTLVVFGLSPSP